MLRLERSQSEIARFLGRNVATICRELRRNHIHRDGYRARRAHPMAVKRRRKYCRRRSVIGVAEALAFERALGVGWSPELFAGRLRLECRGHGPSYSTWYRYARRHQLCRTLLPRYNHRGAGRRRQKQSPEWKMSISERPAHVESRRYFGHWERDTIYAAHRQQLLVLAERKSRYIKIAPLEPNHTIASAAITHRLLAQAKERPIRSITNDNGKSLYDAPHLNIPVYYCDPYKPQQRGTVENINRMLRKYIKPNTSLKSLGAKTLRKIEDTINLRPRKCLGYRTPMEAYRKQRIALAMNI